MCNKIGQPNFTIKGPTDGFFSQDQICEYVHLINDRKIIDIDNTDTIAVFVSEQNNESGI